MGGASSTVGQPQVNVQKYKAVMEWNVNIEKIKSSELLYNQLLRAGTRYPPWPPWSASNYGVDGLTERQLKKLKDEISALEYAVSTVFKVQTGYEV